MTKYILQATVVFPEQLVDPKMKLWADLVSGEDAVVLHMFKKAALAEFEGREFRVITAVEMKETNDA